MCMFCSVTVCMFKNCPSVLQGYRTSVSMMCPCALQGYIQYVFCKVTDRMCVFCRVTER